MRRVLVVDDEENLRLVVRTFLKREGYEVEVAASGEEALALVETFGPDVILTDVRMPKMGGLDLLATLKAKGNDCTVIVMASPPVERRPPVLSTPCAVSVTLRAFVWIWP